MVGYHRKGKSFTTPWQSWLGFPKISAAQWMWLPAPHCRLGNDTTEIQKILYACMHTHTLVLTCTCCSLKTGHVGLPGRGERDSKGILERWLNWLLNHPTADTPWNPQNSGWTWKWSHLWAHHTSVSGWGQGAEKGLMASGYPSRDPTAVTPATSEGNTCY